MSHSTGRSNNDISSGGHCTLTGAPRAVPATPLPLVYAPSGPTLPTRRLVTLLEACPLLLEHLLPSSTSSPVPPQYITIAQSSSLTPYPVSSTPVMCTGSPHGRVESDHSPRSSSCGTSTRFGWRVLVDRVVVVVKRYRFALPRRRGVGRCRGEGGVSGAGGAG